MKFILLLLLLVVIKISVPVCSGKVPVPNPALDYDQLRMSSNEAHSASNINLMSPSQFYKQQTTTRPKATPFKTSSTGTPKTQPGNKLTESSETEPELLLGNNHNYARYGHTQFDHDDADEVRNEAEQRLQVLRQRNIPKSQLASSTRKPQSPPRASSTTQLQHKCYRWWSQDSFKRVDLHAKDLIVSDEYGSPCYIISISAYLEHKGYEPHVYFPLDHFSIHPSSNRVLIDGAASDGATSSNVGQEVLPMNCSIPLGSDGSRFLLPVRPKQYKLFSEDIYLYVECGFLKLRLHTNGYYLALQSIEFHSSFEELHGASNEYGIRHDNNYGNLSGFHFSSKSSPHSPLFVMPFTSRYVCENRVILNSTDSIQLVLDKFLIQRLFISPQGRLRTSPQTTLDIPATIQQMVPVELKVEQKQPPMGALAADTFNDIQITIPHEDSNSNGNNNNHNNHKHHSRTRHNNQNELLQSQDTSNIFQSERFKRAAAAVSGIITPTIIEDVDYDFSVRRCPEPESPFVALDSMMDKELMRNISTLTNLMLSDTNKAQLTSSAPNFKYHHSYSQGRFLVNGLLCLSLVYVWLCC